MHDSTLCRFTSLWDGALPVAGSAGAMVTLLLIAML